MMCRQSRNQHSQTTVPITTTSQTQQQQQQQQQQQSQQHTLYCHSIPGGGLRTEQ
jgi:hypothetical protein